LSLKSKRLMKSKNKKTGVELFDEFYFDVYAQRWSSLRSALEKPVKHVAWILPSEVDRQHPLSPRLEMKSDTIDRGYFLDMASLYAPWALEVKPGEVVLDLCAAPGGKSLFLAHALQGEGELVCTDISKMRAIRLKKVLSEFLTDKELSITKVETRDAKLWPLSQKERFDKILLDAPCSSERHLLLDPSHLKEWKSTRSKRLSKEQGTMLCSALAALKPQGRLVYSTCSISPFENDGLMSWFEKKRSGQFRFVTLDFPMGEKTSYGHHFLPDQCEYGPLYVCVIEKENV
jgi:5-methylcytosine rRNA methyltransferase NSUN4